MICLLPCSNPPSDHHRLHRCLGPHVLLFVLTLVFSSLPEIAPANCPLLRGFTNNTGILQVNRTTIVSTDPTVHCQWLIIGSQYQRIVVEFDHVLIPVPVEEYLKEGCRRGAVSLWTPGLEQEKIHICGDRRHIRIGGVGQILMVEVRIIDPQLDVDFLMHYQLIQLESWLMSLLKRLPLRDLLLGPLSAPPHLRNPSTWPAENYAECGRTSMDGQAFASGVFSRIVGGRQVVPHSHPWQVLLDAQGKFCGATVLNANWIVTAAHCVNGTETGSLVAEFGVHDRYSIETSRVARNIQKIVIHPSYNGKSTRWMHDIALLRLSEPLQLNPFVRSICLPSSSEFVRLADRTIVTGWGETQGTGNFRYLREVEVPIQSNDRCQLNEISWSSSLCAGLCTNDTCDACQGDSGGPMIILKNDRWHLVGLISWGFSCSGLGVYTKVSFYREWIQQWISQ